MITVEQLKSYIPIDETDALIETNLGRAVESAHALILGSVGEDIEELLPGDPRVTELELRYASDIFQGRSSSAKQGAAEDRLTQAMENQLRFELRRRRQGATAT